MSQLQLSLQSRNVFIDTSEFVRLAFGFQSGVLENLSGHPGVRVVLPDVIVREVRKHLKQEAFTSVQEHKKFSDKARVLRTLGRRYAALFEKFSKECLENEFTSSLDDFLALPFVDVIPVPEECLSTVLDRYFDSEPPFGNGKKKSEFPDAIALETIRQWSDQARAPIYVISSDKDHKEYCCEFSQLIYLDRISEFLDILVQADQEFGQKAKQTIRDYVERIEEVAKSEFESQLFFIEDCEGEVLSVKVEYIQISNLSIIELEGYIATVEGWLSIHFSAEVRYQDLETATWDHETRSYFFAEETFRTLEREHHGMVRANIRFAIDPPHEIQVKDLEVGDRDDYGLWVVDPVS